MADKSLNNFAFEIFPFILTIFGFFSNLFVFIIFSRKKLKQVPGHNLLKFLAIIDFLNCLISFNRFNKDAFLGHSLFTCKLGNYIVNTFPATSAWLLCYISVEKLLTIMKPTYKQLLFEKTRYQIFVCSSIFVFNLAVYSPVLTLNDIFKDNANGTENDYFVRCEMFKSYFFDLISNFHLIQSAILPFAIMFTCSIYLVIFIFKSRKRTFTTYSMQNKKILKKDIQFAMQTLFLDILFVGLNSPLSIARILKDDLWFPLSRILYFFRFSLNFFIYLAFNSIYRKEFLFFLKL